MKSMLLLSCWSLLAFLAGCGKGTPDASSKQGPPKAPAASNPGEPAPSLDAAGKTITLNPENTSIEFIGNHTGEDPKPRHGSFQNFSGAAVVDQASLQSISVEIETASLTTEIEKLTNHLKNADFFDVNQFPKASFRSTQIKDNGDGAIEITGDLTLLDQTNSVTFPATLETDNGLKLKAQFEIDRTQWGMNFGPDQIEKQVPITITING